MVPACLKSWCFGFGRIALVVVWPGQGEIFGDEFNWVAVARRIQMRCFVVDKRGRVLNLIWDPHFQDLGGFESSEVQNLIGRLFNIISGHTGAICQDAETVERTSQLFEKEGWAEAWLLLPFLSSAELNEIGSFVGCTVSLSFTSSNLSITRLAYSKKSFVIRWKLEYECASSQDRCRLGHHVIPGGQA